MSPDPQDANLYAADVQSAQRRQGKFSIVARDKGDGQTAIPPVSFSKAAVSALSEPTAVEQLRVDLDSCLDARSRQRRPGKFSMAAESKGMAQPTEVMMSPNASPREIPRSTTSQLYRVVFPSSIAVRENSSLTSKAIRALAPGALVKCYEWDHSRKWRRVTMEVQVEDDDNPGFLKLQDADGWVLTHHPLKGQLLEAYLEDTGAAEAAESAAPDPVADAASPSSPSAPPKGQKAEGREDSSQSGSAVSSSNAETSPEPEAPSGYVPQPGESLVVAMARQALLQQHNMAPANSSMFKAAQKSDFRSLILPEDKLESSLASAEERPASDKEPLIMRAARAGSYDAVVSLLASGCNPNEADTFGETALFEASSRSHTEIVGRLLLCNADATITNRSNITAFHLVTHDPTRALMLRCSGKESHERDLSDGLLLCRTLDRTRLMKKFNLPEPQANMSDAAAVAKEEVAKSIDDGKELGIGQNTGTATTTTSQTVIPESEPAAPAASAAGFASSATSTGAAISMSQPSQSSAHEPDSPQFRSPLIEELELDERGVPKRTEVATKYRVVHKMVAVRKYPNQNAAVVRAFKQGDEVDMFEWDHTRQYRRIRTQMQLVETGPLEEVDGWMLLFSGKFGSLLEPAAEDDEDSDGMAG